MKATVPIKVSIYEKADGSVPFEKWLDSLDIKARARLLARIAKVRSGNLGDWSSLKTAEGVCEFREFFGPGYRVYFARQEQQVILLLCGSDKSDQKKAIKLAVEYWLDYQNRAV